ncbi:hypothetical protein [Klebsiella variicola]|uniref:hypothetical protein n=1 Tax=Klebsiella variicola TaxID=244366 RepID=UPI0015A12677|nr:hypothetical protein [Klebsiella variicola]
MSMIDIFGADHPEYVDFYSRSKNGVLCCSRWFQRRYRPWLNNYQRTDYLNGVFNRPVGDKLVRPLFLRR